MSVPTRLIEILADGEFHSGESLGQLLAVSRAAIWKQVRGLQQLGLDVHAVRGRGYRLAEPLELLDADCIKRALAAPVNNSLQSFELFHQIDSTSDHLKQHCIPVTAGHAHACLAEWQQAGRGRRGRQWVSPYGSNLYLSLAWGFDEVPAGLGGLSLAAGVAVARALADLGIDGVGLKWPNDIVLANGKLAGILVDVQGESAGPCSVIIGVGINTKMPAAAAAAIDQAWSDLSGFESVSRNRLAAAVINQLVTALHTFSAEGLQGFQAAWRLYDVIEGQVISLQTGTRRIVGTACGIDEQGALKVTSQGHTRSYHAGEISIRLAS